MNQEQEVETVAEWEHAGHDCKVTKVPLGHYCGYVRVPDLDADYDDLNGAVLVNGGLTWGPDDEGWYGFDCAHAWDKCLDEDGEPWGTDLPPLGPNATLWTLDGVKEEVEDLAEQLAEISVRQR